MQRWSLTQPSDSSLICSDLSRAFSSCLCSLSRLRMNISLSPAPPWLSSSVVACIIKYQIVPVLTDTGLSY